MDVSRRLRELRKAKGLSQGDIELKTGLMRCYVSRVEGGHSVPSTRTLEKWTHALGVTMSEFFGRRKFVIEAPKRAGSSPSPGYERQLIAMVRNFSHADKYLLMAVARRIARQGGRHGG